MDGCRKIKLNENQFNKLVAKCVKKALNEGFEIVSYRDKPYAEKLGELVGTEIADIMLDILSNEDVYKIVDTCANEGIIDSNWFDNEIGY